MCSSARTDINFTDIPNNIYFLQLFKATHTLDTFLPAKLCMNFINAKQSSQSGMQATHCKFQKGYMVWAMQTNAYINKAFETW
jgi:hypothetical protein